MQSAVEEFELNRLPVLPQVLTRLLQELDADNLQLRSLAELIGQDSGLTLKILSVANSSYFRRQREVTSIEQSVNTLGLGTVKMIALSTAMQQFLNQLLARTPFDFNAFWLHSLNTAFIAKALAQAAGVAQTQEAYVAGLLHDIGKLAMACAKPDEYGRLLAESPDDALLEQEQRRYGITHAEVGAEILARWGISAAVCAAVADHHDLSERMLHAPELNRILMLANDLVDVGPDSAHPGFARVQMLLRVPPEQTMRLCVEAQASVVALALPLGVQMQAGKPGVVREDTQDTNPLAAAMQASAMLALSRDVFAQAAGEEALLESLVCSAMVLFEPREALIFEWDAKTSQLVGKPLNHQPEALARMRCALEQQTSLVADAILWNAATTSFCKADHNVPSLKDEQLIRLANAEGIVCIPLTTAKFIYGVLVLAGSRRMAERLERDQSLALSFARQMAAAMLALRKRAEDAATSRVQTDNPEALEAYRLHARQVVHEASNPLSILKNYLKLLEFKLADNTSAANELQVLNEEIDRVAGIIRKFAQGPAAPADAAVTVHLNNIIRNVAGLCETSLLAPAGISLRLQLEDSLPQVRLDADKFKQVLINLLKNAAEAMREGGTVTVTTAFTVHQGKTGMVALSIADDGPGIPPQVLENLFSPVRTTKGEGHAGLGLSIVSQIINELGGQISCKSSAAGGTCFDIIIPCQRPGAAGQTALRQQPQAPRHREY